MAQHRLGCLDEAKRLLDVAAKAVRQQVEGTAPLYDWEGQLEAEVLLPEVEEFLKKPPAQTKP